MDFVTQCSKHGNTPFWFIDNMQVKIRKVGMVEHFQANFAKRGQYLQYSHKFLSTKT